MLTQLFQQIAAAGSCSLDEGHMLISFKAAPSLLLYSYIPAVIIALGLSYIIFRNNRKDITARSFFIFSLLYSLWVLNILVQWVAVPNSIILAAWQFTAFFEVGFYLAALYFFISFITKKPLKKSTQVLFFSLLSLIIILLPSILNIQSYDFENCEGKLGTLWYVIYAFEIIVPIIVLVRGIAYSRKNESLGRKEILLFSTAMAIFLGIFSASNIAGEFFQVYSFNLFGPLGMLIFIGLVTYLILRFKAFNIKLFSTQVLVLCLCISIAALALINNLLVVHVITILTFILSVVFGTFLIKSVKKEIEQRERLEQLRLKLEESNLKLEAANDKLKDLDKLKTEFLSLATHQIRSPLTAIKGYASMVVEGSFGEINDKAKEAIDRILQSSNNLAIIIEDFLNVSKIEAGGMKYEKINFDFGEIAGGMAKDLSITAEKKGLKLSYTQDTGNHTVNGDKEKLRQVVLNLIDNSIKYTKEGSIDVSVTTTGDKVLFAVKDTGMGMTEAIKVTLFQKFARGEGGRVNTTGSGLGLYLAKEIAVAHGGRVWVESPGPSKGSTFFMELAVAK
jgi:signal transduction histidine kinase